MKNVPSLESLTVGIDSFYRGKNCMIEKASNLKYLKMGEKGDINAFSAILKEALQQKNPITISNSITGIRIPGGSYNDMNYLNMVGFPSLKELIIGEKCFLGTESVRLERMESIESLHIGASSFYNVQNVTIQSLPSLETVSLEENSLYCNHSNSSVILSDLPSLQNITSEGSSFRGASSVTISNTPNVTVVELPFGFENTDNRFISGEFN